MEQWYVLSKEDRDYVLEFLKDIAPRVEGVVFQMRVDKSIKIMQGCVEMR